MLSVEGVTKRFGATKALAGVDLAIHPGSVRALIGMNGSGKSTLVKVLSGFHAPDEGRIMVSGRSLEEAATEDRAAMAFVHQDLALVPGMSVIENLALGRSMATRHGRIDWAAERSRAQRALAPFALEAVADANVGELTKAEATVVAIARALERCDEGCSVLVLDEPTSTLPASQTEHLLEVMRGCARRGIGVLFISHRLREVLAVSDAVTVLRNGAVSADEATADATLERLVHAMVGDASGPLDRVLDDGRQGAYGERERQERARPAERPPVLTAAGVSGQVVEDANIEIRPGEIVGFAGLLGSGVEELGALLAGRDRPVAGRVELEGALLTRDALRRIGFVPADRGANGVLPGLSARENAVIADASRYVRGGRISVGLERRTVGEWFDEMTVHPPDPEIDMIALSGGNQQKVLLARWLSIEPAALVAEEPTQGVDVYAKAQILERLAAHAAGGLAVVLLSGEPEEISPICDRMVVLRDGRVSDELTRPFATGDIVAAMH